MQTSASLDIHSNVAPIGVAPVLAKPRLIGWSEFFQKLGDDARLPLPAELGR